MEDRLKVDDGYHQRLTKQVENIQIIKDNGNKQGKCLNLFLTEKTSLENVAF